MGEIGGGVHQSEPSNAFDAIGDKMVHAAHVLMSELTFLIYPHPRRMQARVLGGNPTPPIRQHAGGVLHNVGFQPMTRTREKMPRREKAGRCHWLPASDACCT